MKCFIVNLVDRSLHSLGKLRSVNCYEIFFSGLALHLCPSEYPINCPHCNNFSFSMILGKGVMWELQRKPKHKNPTKITKFEYFAIMLCFIRQVIITNLNR